ncbi:phosphatidylglycerophosphatase B [Acerihabitans sp. TG2]|uniref:phosphatidylglycerophosphatase B n=1 Tax=Acerihabitans sp. TG2 TaxID=3096008 RepID=UPI002B23432C|nr:phosphatidylglycerophosphatase B [Acerihabitans sp. TG2]MEA9389420.1 phosphatidylglycerophosphatase B [Acerihabitans sp. TG2]
MFEIAKRTGFGAMVLIIIPFLVWVSGWLWHPQNEAAWWRLMFWITQTATAPWSMITSTLLMVWLLWCLRFRFKPALGLVCIVAAALLIGQSLKSFIKQQVQEPRPYVLWLEHTHNIDDRVFYSLPRNERSLLVKSELQDQQNIPPWLGHHWQHETGFAFPSGHTVFAASWALLALGLLWSRRHVVSLTLIVAWAAAVMCSRLVLGMHWPRDLIVGTALSWLIITLACWLVQRWITMPTPDPNPQHDRT